MSDAIEARNVDLSTLTSAIVDSYQTEPLTRHLDSGYLPSRDEVIQLTKLLRELLFPGFFGRQNLTSKDVAFHVGDLLGVIHEKLYRQARAAIRHQQDREGNFECSNCDATAREITDEFLGNIPAVREVLATDAKAAFDGDPAAHSHDEIIFSYPGFLAVTIYRLAHELFLLRVPLVPRMMSEYAHSLTGVDIHPGATIGRYFFIDHATAVVIGETTKIGERVKIYQGVTLGAISTREGQGLRGVKRHPTLEDDVTVYPNASILGGETIIGTGATIGGNVFITQSVPPHTRVTVKHPELQYRNRPPKEFKPGIDFQI